MKRERQNHRVVPAMHRDFRGAEPWPELVYVHPSACVEEGVMVEVGTRQNTRIDAGAWVMLGAHIGHDATVGIDAQVATRAIIGAHAEIQERAEVGIGAVVMPFRRVGVGAVVGAGAVVTHDVRPGAVVAGNPARELLGRNPVPYSQRRQRALTRDEQLERDRATEDEWERVAAHRPDVADLYEGVEPVKSYYPDVADLYEGVEPVKSYHGQLPAPHPCA